MLAALLTAPAWAAVPPPRGHVNDFAEVIDPQTEAALEEELRALASQTGAEVAVATVDQVPDGDIERAAVEWFQAWGVGRRAHDDGALILCAVRDRKVRIEVGYGLEPVLPDAVCGRIIRDVMVPAFRAGRFGDGLAAGARAVAAHIRAAAAQTSDGTSPGAGIEPALSKFAETLIVFLAFGLVIGLALWIESRASPQQRAAGHRRDGDWGGWSSSGGFGGGGGGDFGGGGFGGFGGGSSGGGGASGSW